MPVIDVTKNLDDRSITITAEFAAPVERVWQIYADPRQLEKVWGPPEYPATFVDHDLAPGGRVTYYMTGPDGEKYAGYWADQTARQQTSLGLLVAALCHIALVVNWVQCVRPPVGHKAGPTP